MKEGYISLTHPYTLPEEEEAFERAVASLKRGKRRYLVYHFEDTAEIYIQVTCGENCQGGEYRCMKCKTNGCDK